MSRISTRPIARVKYDLSPGVKMIYRWLRETTLRSHLQTICCPQNCHLAAETAIYQNENEWLPSNKNKWTAHLKNICGKLPSILNFHANLFALSLSVCVPLSLTWQFLLIEVVWIFTGCRAYTHLVALKGSKILPTFAKENKIIHEN